MKNLNNVENSKTTLRNQSKNSEQAKAGKKSRKNVDKGTHNRQKLILCRTFTKSQGKKTHKNTDNDETPNDAENSKTSRNRSEKALTKALTI